MLSRCQRCRRTSLPSSTRCDGAANAHRRCGRQQRLDWRRGDRWRRVAERLGTKPTTLPPSSRLPCPETAVTVDMCMVGPWIQGHGCWLPSTALQINDGYVRPRLLRPLLRQAQLVGGSRSLPSAFSFHQPATPQKRPPRRPPSSFSVPSTRTMAPKASTDSVTPTVFFSPKDLSQLSRSASGWEAMPAGGPAAGLATSGRPYLWPMQGVKPRAEGMQGTGPATPTRVVDGCPCWALQQGPPGQGCPTDCSLQRWE